jgi:hypothetical protein
MGHFSNTQRLLSFLFLIFVLTSSAVFAQTANVNRGKLLYDSEAQCATCHHGFAPDINASGRSATTMAILNSAIQNNRGGMSIISFLTQEQRADIVAYIVAYRTNPLAGAGPVPLTQTINFPVLNSFVWNSPGAALSATATSSLPVTYSILSGNCTIVGSQLTSFGTGSCTVAANQLGNASFSPATQVTRSVTIGVGDFSDMWWAGSTQNGWGMSVQQHGTTQFNALYVYDQQGMPRWYVMPGGMWNNNFTVYTGLVYQPTSAPFNAYDKTKFVAGAPSGSVTLSYQADGTMTLQYSIGSTSSSKIMSRQSFADNTAPFKANDLWWAGLNEDGWGINIAQQQGNLFGVWYTYGADGKATWYVLPAGIWTGNTFEGLLYSTTGSNWFGIYDPLLLLVEPVGTLKFSFSNIVNGAAQNAAMTYRVGSVTQTKNIERQAF